MIAELVDIGYAFDDGAIGWDQVCLFYADPIANPQLRRRHDLDLTVLAQTLGDEIKSRLPQRRSLSFTASFRQGLGVIREPHCEKENCCDDAIVKARSAARPEQFRLDRQSKRHQCSNPDHEHDGIANLHARIKLEQGVLESLP